MKLIFDRLIVQNFRSFIGTHTIELDHGAGLVCVRGLNEAEPELGANGAGKSSIFGALTWALYGKTADGLRNTDIKAWGTANERTRVRVDVFFDDEQTAHSITRSIKPNKITFNGEPIDQDALEKRIRLSYLTFKHTILQGQGQPLFVDLEPRIKMGVLAEALDLQRWDERSKRANAKATEIMRTIDKTTTLVEHAKGSLVEVDGKIKATTTKQNTWLAEMEDIVGKAGVEMKHLNKQLETLSNLRAEQDLTYDKVSVKVREYKAECDRLADLIEKVNENENKIRVRLGAASRRALEVKKELDGLGKGDRCPTCGQSLKGTARAEHKAVVAQRYQAALAEAKPTPELEKLVSKKADLDKRTKAARATQREYEAKVDIAFDALHKTETRVAEVKTRCEALAARMRQYDAEQNPYTALLNDLKRQKSKLQDTIEDGEKSIDASSARHKQVSYWINGFKDVRLYTIEDVVKELEMCANVMLAQVGMPDWAFRYDIEKETASGGITRGLAIMILSPSNREPVRFECWSGGEAQRLRLVSALALSEVLLNHAGVEPSLEILDEPTQHLSAEGRMDICELLADRAKQIGRTILLADHTITEGAKFKRTMFVVKDKHGSHIRKG